jgi:hypothetical protein
MTLSKAICEADKGERFAGVCRACSLPRTMELATGSLSDKYVLGEVIGQGERRSLVACSPSAYRLVECLARELEDTT